MNTTMALRRANSQPSRLSYTLERTLSPERLSHSQKLTYCPLQGSFTILIAKSKAIRIDVILSTCSPLRRRRVLAMCGCLEA